MPQAATLDIRVQPATLRDDDRAVVAAMLVDAAQPYLRALYGDSSAAAEILIALMKNASSEFAPSHARVLFQAGKPLGCYVAVPGTDLPSCRRVELCEALRSFGSGAAASLGGRLALLGPLFPPVRASEFYLSKLAVHVAARGRGLGRLLLNHYFEQGRQRGFRRFRLDVSKENHVALRLYEAAGFRVLEERHSVSYGLTYLAMLAEK